MLEEGSRQCPLRGLKIKTFLVEVARTKVRLAQDEARIFTADYRL